MSEQNGKKTDRRAIFVVGQKGGAGKTTWCRAYLDVMRAAGVKVAAYDADGQVGQLIQYYGSRTDKKLDVNQDPITGVAYFDIRDEKQRDVLVNATETDADVILMDLPGGSMQEIAKVIGDGKTDAKWLFEVYRKAGFEPVVVVVISHMIASVRTVAESIRLFGDTAKYVVVKNLFYAEPDEFVVFDGFTDKAGRKKHGKGRETLEKLGGHIVHMPKLLPRTYALLDVESMPFSHASENEDLTPAERLRVGVWLEEFAKALEDSVLAPAVVVK